MTFLVIHLSDIHMKEASNLDSVIIDKIKSVISNDSIGIDNVLFIITGDIANAGKDTEYYSALGLINEITASARLKNKYIVMCPGNHDKNLSENESVHDDIVDKVVKNKDITQEEYDFLNKFFNHYNEFTALVESDNKYECNRKNFVTSYLMTFNDITIQIDSINTALCSKKRCNHASLYMPINAIPQKKSNLISILLMHNTENWMNHESRREYRDAITSSYDFIFTGHEHAGYNYKVEGNSGNETIMIEGGSIYPHSADEAPEFNTVLIDTNKNTALIKRYEFKSELGFFQESHCNGFPFGGKAISVHVNTTAVSIHKDIILDIQDSGAPYRHPVINNLTLDDLFIYPDIQKFEYSTSKGQFSPLSQSMSNIDCLSGRHIFLGTEKSGKSHCSRKIFLNSVKSGNIPIIVKINEKSNIYNITDLEKEIQKVAKTTYQNIDIDAFKQTASCKKNILIDDFHSLRTNNAKKYKVLGELAKIYPNICIFSDESTQFDTLLYSKENGTSLYDAFNIYTILPFNNQKRDELIRKWHQNDLPYDESPVTVERSIEQSRTVLNTVVKNGFVPSYPFFLYTALSSFTIPNTDAKIEESTYGHFFTTLLNIALIHISPKGDQNDLYFNYLTEFAFKLFTNNNSSMTISEYNDFHLWYIDEFSLSKPYSDMIDKLVSAKLLQKRDDIVFFRYKYFYFYFLAKHLTASLHDEETKATISSFCDSLHQEISSNVLMFLIHLSKDQSIINELINKAKTILSSYKEADLKKNISFIDDLMNELPEMVFHSEENHAAEKKKMIAMADDVEKLPDSSTYSGDNIKPLKKEDKFPEKSTDFNPNAIADAFKTIEIVGQIMRNYHGSLRTSLKDSLCKEAYSLTLRSITAFFEVLSADRDGIVDELAKALEKISSEQKEKRVKAAQKFLFSVASMLAYAFIAKCASELGSSNLSVTFKRILGRYEPLDNLAVYLIDIAIKFDHQVQSPTEDVKRLSQKCTNSNIGFIVLRLLTYRHMYMFPLPIEIKQKLCQSTKILLKNTALLPHKI